MRSLRATIFEFYWNPQFDPTYYIYLGSNQLSKYLGSNQPSLQLVRTNLVYIQVRTNLVYIQVRTNLLYIQVRTNLVYIQVRTNLVYILVRTNLVYIQVPVNLVYIQVRTNLVYIQVRTNLVYIQVRTNLVEECGATDKGSRLITNGIYFIFRYFNLTIKSIKQSNQLKSNLNKKKKTLRQLKKKYRFNDYFTKRNFGALSNSQYYHKISPLLANFANSNFLIPLSLQPNVGDFCWVKLRIIKILNIKG